MHCAILTDVLQNLINFINSLYKSLIISVLRCVLKRLILR